MALRETYQFARQGAPKMAHPARRHSYVRIPRFNDATSPPVSSPIDARTTAAIPQSLPSGKRLGTAITVSPAEKAEQCRAESSTAKDP